MTTGTARIGAAPLWRYFSGMDEARRLRGRWMEFCGYGPRRSPSRLIHQTGMVALHAYDAPGPGVPVVLVPAPIKRAYIWDIAPGASVVQRCLRAGLRPYLVEWSEPESDAGFAAYCGPMLRGCVVAARRDSQARRAFVAGHSLGGLIATGYAARHAEQVAGLIVLASPLHFDYGSSTGALGPVVAAADRLRVLQGEGPNLPGSLLSSASLAASPATFSGERMTDWLRSADDPEASTLHLRVLRWTMDEQALSRRLVDELVTTVYRHNALLTNRLVVDGRPVGAASMSAPLLIVGDRRCAIAPPASVLPFYDTAATRDKKLLWYEGDVGVALQHVGVLVGRNAGAMLWPRIFAWIHARARSSHVNEEEHHADL